jgi:hypothetical protein
VAKAKRKTLPKGFATLLEAGDVQALKRVFDSCELDARGGVTKQTALAFADCPDALTRWLVEQGADLGAADSYGETPLHARAGHWKGRIAPLVELGADVNHPAGGRATPLHRAAASGNLEAAKILLQHGARVDKVNNAGQTPLVFALQRCSNVTIERTAPMAELLLDATPAGTAKPKSLFGRLLGRDPGHESRVTPEMKDLIQRIGTNFECHRANFDPDSVDAVSHALDRLYGLFGVPPVPRRILHDGTSPIVVGHGAWENQHQALWELLVPSQGAAATAQGEVIRIAGRITDELNRNGGANWDRDYKKMADAFLAHLQTGRPLPDDALVEARQIVSEVKAQQGEPTRLGKLAVDWVSRNPMPIALPPPDYTR